MAERNYLEFQIRAAARPTSEPRRKRRDESEHAGDTTVGQDKIARLCNRFGVFRKGNRPFQSSWQLCAEEGHDIL